MATSEPRHLRASSPARLVTCAPRHLRASVLERLVTKLESELAPQQLEDVVRGGVAQALAAWKTWLYDDGVLAPTVGHLNGAVARPWAETGALHGGLAHIVVYWGTVPSGHDIGESTPARSSTERPRGGCDFLHYPRVTF
jgi:hypothetical protein